MGVNRYSNLSQAKFNPLSFQELSALPFHQRKQHDAMSAQAEEAGIIESQRMAADEEAVSGAINDFQAKTDDYINRLDSEGFNNTSKSEIRELARERKELMSTGIVGRKQAQYDRYAANMKQLDKRRDKGDIDVLKHRLLQQKAVEDYNTAIKNDPNSTYQDVMAVNDYDYQKEATKIAKDVTSAMHTNNFTKFGFEAIKGAPGQYMHAKTQTKYKKADAISKAIQDILGANKDVQMDLAQRQQLGMFGEKGTGADYLKSVADKIGNAYEVNQTTITKTGFTHKAQFEEYKRNLDDQTKLQFVRASQGVSTTLNSGNLQDIENLNQSAIVELSGLKKKIDTFSGDVNSREYHLLKTQYNEKFATQANLKSRLSGIKQVALSNFNTDEKTLYNAHNTVYAGVDTSSEYDTRYSLQDKVENLEDYQSLINKSPILKRIMSTGGMTYSDEKLIDVFSSTILESNNNRLRKQFDNGDISQKEFDESYTKLNLNKDGYDPNIETKLNATFARGNKAIDTHLKNSPYAESYVSFAGPSTGKYATSIGAINSNLTNSFTGAGYSTAYDNQDLNLKLQEIEKEAGKKVNKSIEVTDGFTPEGYPIEHLVLSVDGKLIDRMPVTRGSLVRSEFMQVGRELMKSSDPDKYSRGKQMVANLQLLPYVNKAGLLTSAKEGIIPINLKDAKTKESMEVSWKKEGDGWTIKIGDRPESIKLYSKNEIVNYLFNKSK
jgi:hypothetical protein